MSLADVLDIKRDLAARIPAYLDVAGVTDFLEAAQLSIGYVQTIRPETPYPDAL